jgi:hypothetical protein
MAVPVEGGGDPLRIEGDEHAADWAGVLGAWFRYGDLVALGATEEEQDCQQDGDGFESDHLG